MSGSLAPTPSLDGKWRILGATCHGASHVRAGLPNQDAITWKPDSDPNLDPPLVLAIADGHGSSKCFRSDVGARTAVDVSSSVIQEFLENVTLQQRTGPNPQELIPRNIVIRWRNAIEQYDKQKPAHMDEGFSKLSESDQLSLYPLPKDVGGERFEHVPYLAYGSTILAVALTEEFMIFLQLGDGDIVTVPEGGKTPTRPLPADDRLFANETTSLSSSTAVQDFRFHFHPFAPNGSGPDPRPALVLVSTDGYANSFRSEEGFLRVGTDLYRMIASGGLELVQSDIAEWLDEASRTGSGDDVTLGLICRLSAFQPSKIAHVTTPLSAQDLVQPVRSVRSNSPHAYGTPGHATSHRPNRRPKVHGAASRAFQKLRRGLRRKKGTTRRTNKRK